MDRLLNRILSGRNTVAAGSRADLYMTVVEFLRITVEALELKHASHGCRRYGDHLKAKCLAKISVRGDLHRRRMAPKLG
jgi:hypothetical protein